MSRVTIELPSSTEQKLREKASMNGESLEFYLQKLAKKDAFEANGTATPAEEEELSLDELDTLLDELAKGTPPLVSLSADFSRKDIYAEHD